MINDVLVRRVPAPPDSGRRAGLVAANEADDEALTKIPLAETVSIRVTRGRSLQQWRLYWAILKYVAEASKFETPERLYVALKIRLGYYDLLKMPNGKVVPVPQSFNFATKDQDEAQKLFDDSMRVICEDVLPGQNSDDLIAEVQLMLGSGVKENV